LPSLDVDRKEAVTEINRITHSVVPPTPAEAAAASANWDRRGIFGRLVRLDDEVALVEERRRAPRATRQAAAAARSH